MTRRRENASIAGQNLPPEFRFQPTRIYYSDPPRNIIYEDAMGSQGKAPLDPRLSRQLDPIHWQSGRSPLDNMRRTTEGVVSQLTHHLRHERSNKPTVVRRLHKGTVHVRIEEPKDARRPLLRGGRTPEEVARGAKLMAVDRTTPDMETIEKVLSSRHGFTRGSRRSYAALLARSRAETVETLACAVERRDEKHDEPRLRVGGAELTRDQIASMPPGYLREIIRRRERRDAQEIQPRVRFDPRESRGRSLHGQYTEIPRPGLVPAGDGTYLYPAQKNDDSNGFGALGATTTNNSWPLAAMVIMGVVGAAMIFAAHRD